MTPLPPGSQREPPSALDDCLRGVQDELPRTGLRGAALSAVATDIRSRVADLLGAYREGTFGHATLTALEEAFFYEPASSPLLIRQLVVAGVRNSLLERYHADPFNTPSDKKIGRVTRRCAELFGRVGLERLASAASPSSPRWSELSRRFPATWRAFGELARLDDGGAISHEVWPTGERCELPSLRSKEEERVVLNGMEPSIDPHLAGALERLASGDIQVLFVPSFKFLSRNPEKVLRVIEFVLSHGGTFLTFNFLLRPNLSARRARLIRPAHGSEWAEALSRDDGLFTEHAEALASIRTQFLEG